MNTPKAPRLRGFAALSPERRAQISAQGGRAAHAKGVAHEWTNETAIEAAKKSMVVRKITPRKK